MVIRGITPVLERTIGILFEGLATKHSWTDRTICHFFVMIDVSSHRQFLTSRLRGVYRGLVSHVRLTILQFFSFKNNCFIATLLDRAADIKVGHPFRFFLRHKTQAKVLLTLVVEPHARARTRHIEGQPNVFVRRLLLMQTIGLRPFSCVVWTVNFMLKLFKFLLHLLLVRVVT